MSSAPPKDDKIARRPGRSHPPSLLRLAERLIRDERLVERGDVVLCACSGGPDSTALLSVLAHLRSRLRFELVAHGVDHGLRPDAAAELDLAARHAASLGVPFGATRVDVAPGGNLQARAREARRAALAETARAAGACRIATGHTADDRAETFLLRLLRGAGPRGLAVLPPSAPLSEEPPSEEPPSEEPPSEEPRLTLIRPLLLARRVDVTAHLARHGLAFAQDPSNRDARFLRARVRNELLPLLESMSPKVTEHLCALAEMLAKEPVSAEDLRGLGRAQRLSIARAKKCERSVNLRLAGGLDVLVGFSGEKVVLMNGRRPRG